LEKRADLSFSLSLGQLLECVWDGAFGGFQAGCHALGNAAHGIDLSLPWNQVFFASINKADHLKIPRWFTEFFKNFSVSAPLIIRDRYRDKVLLDELDKRLMGKDFGPEDTATVSSWNFLKE